MSENEIPTFKQDLSVIEIPIAEITENLDDIIFYFAENDHDGISTDLRNSLFYIRICRNILNGKIDFNKDQTSVIVN